MSRNRATIIAFKRARDDHLRKLKEIRVSLDRQVVPVIGNTDKLYNTWRCKWIRAFVSLNSYTMPRFIQLSIEPVSFISIVESTQKPSEFYVLYFTKFDFLYFTVSNISYSILGKSVNSIFSHNTLDETVHPLLSFCKCLNDA